MRREGEEVDVGGERGEWKERGLIEISWKEQDKRKGWTLRCYGKAGKSGRNEKGLEGEDLAHQNRETWEHRILLPRVVVTSMVLARPSSKQQDTSEI